MKRETLHAKVNEIYGCEFTKDELKNIEYEYKMDDKTIICSCCNEVVTSDDEIMEQTEWVDGYEFEVHQWCPFCREYLDLVKPDFLKWCELDKEGLSC